MEMGFWLSLGNKKAPTPVCSPVMCSLPLTKELRGTRYTENLHMPLL